MKALWDEVRGRQRVYLDTRFWIWLRDAAMGRPKLEIHTRLLTLLRHKVQAGQIVCPIGDGSLIEVLRQSDPHTRLTTAKVMDELSLGVTIQNAEDRLKTEVAHFFGLAKTPGAEMAPPLEAVWLKAAYALGVLHPVPEGIDAAEKLAVAKTFFDLMWSLTLEELLTDTPMLPDEVHRSFCDTASELTVASKACAAEIRDWKTLYIDEVNGFFDAYSDDVQSVFVRSYEHQHPGRPQPTQSELQDCKRLLVNSFTNLIRLDKTGSVLPRAQIEAGLHAVVRWHKTRPFTAQDFVDITHATAALPYCHLFLTERFLGTALTRPPLDFGRRFAADIVWDAESAVKAVENLKAPSVVLP